MKNEWFFEYFFKIRNSTELDYLARGVLPGFSELRRVQNWDSYRTSYSNVSSCPQFLLPPLEPLKNGKVSCCYGNSENVRARHIPSHYVMQRYHVEKSVLKTREMVLSATLVLCPQGEPPTRKHFSKLVDIMYRHYRKEDVRIVANNFYQHMPKQHDIAETKTSVLWRIIFISILLFRLLIFL